MSPLGTVSDVASLRRQVDRLLDAEQEGVYGVDREGRATIVTPSVAAMTGHPLSELVGRTMHEVLHHSHADGQCYPRNDCPIYAAFRDGKTHHAAEVFWRRDGSSFPIEYTSTPLVRGGELVGAVVVFRDLGQRQSVRDRIFRALDGAAKGGRGDCPPGVASAALGLPLGDSPAWRSTMDLVRRVAAAPTTVLLCGESGTGKELVARAIHELGPRCSKPLVKVNCAAVPASLIESELFGHERGAFTGATGQRIGRFEQAGEGTLFLDEVGELPLEAQSKLLRVLQEREFERVGGTRTLPCPARIITATNRDLGAMVVQGRFRADLHYRLNVFPVHLPPLRDRRSDIPLLAAHFLQKLERRLERPLRGLHAGSEARLLAHHWPGNVRELENVIERAALLSDGPFVQIPSLEGPRAVAGSAVPTNAPPPAQIAEALARAGWKITGPRGAAASLGVHPNTLRYQMKRLGLARPKAAP